MEDSNLGGFIFWAIMLFGAFKLGEALAMYRIGKSLLDGLAEHGVQIKRNPDGTIEFDMEDTEDTYLVVERVGSQYFAYTDEGEFMGQGVDFKSLFVALKQRHPNTDFRVSKEQKSLSTEEVDEMIKCIFEVYNDKELNNGETGK